MSVVENDCVRFRRNNVSKWSVLSICSWTPTSGALHSVQMIDHARWAVTYPQMHVRAFLSLCSGLMPMEPPTIVTPGGKIEARKFYRRFVHSRRPKRFGEAPARDSAVSLNEFCGVSDAELELQNVVRGIDNDYMYLWSLRAGFKAGD